jgi:hypothetical protein
VGPGGVLYGTTSTGGSGNCEGVLDNLGCGAVFELTPPAAPGAAWTEIVIYNFTAANGDGAFPVTGVVLGKNGVLYGTTGSGGAISGSPCSFFGIIAGCGILYELTPPASPGGPWTETILHSFTGQNGDGGIPGPLTVSVSAGAIIPIMPVEKSPAPRAGGVNPESGIQRREYMCLGGKTWTKLTSSNEKD